MLKKHLPLLLVLLLAFLLRIYNLTEIPPGLTHDEADHVHEAVGVIAGVWRLYFPLGSGREPLYSYLLAAAMALGGRNLFVFRYVIVLFNMLALAVTHRWAQRAFGKRTAIVASGLFAVSFWAVSASRQALRSGLLPFFTAGSVLCFWLAINNSQGSSASNARRRWIYWAGFVFFLSAMLYTYMAARIYWALFPTFVVYLALLNREMFRRAWGFVLSGLALVAVLVAPLFIHLQRNPELETRLGMLTGPLDALREGDVMPLLTNSLESLAGLVFEGAGDTFLAYNIPGRPVLTEITAVFFIIGVLISMWRWRKPAYGLLLMWFVVGISPSLVTGVMASTTRNVAAMPPIYLLPAVGFTAVANWVAKRLKIGDWRLKPISNLQSPITLLVIIWLVFVSWGTARDYFVRWGEAPEVRGAYQHTLVEEFAYLKQNDVTLPVVISTVYPGPAHDPAISLILAPGADSEIRWVDARFALLFPGGGNGRILIPNSTPIHPTLRDFMTQLDAVSLRSDDLDPGFILYELDTEQLAGWNGRFLANFNNAIHLQAAEWITPDVVPGATAELLTVWRVADADRLGPLHPPANVTELNLFTHVVDKNGNITAQQDALDAPSWSWQTGDLIIQIHSLAVPADTRPADYNTFVGIYDRITGERLSIIDANGNPTNSQQQVTPLKTAQ